ncbi:MAG: hypothetical protein JWM58_2110 [Rhizobium sp.]|nr:hypothetical protein [Rhizobium sp.]
MTSAPVYTPYDDTTKPFSIGLTALDPDKWIEPDGDLNAFLAEKDRLASDHFSEIFYSEDTSHAAQQECLEIVVNHLLDRHGHIYKRHGDTVQFAGRTIDLADPATLPLLKAGSLVQDDLVILQKRDTGWHLTAGYVAFPSAWSLPEKAGLPMEGVHAHVPGFEGGTRNAMMINRIFDNLQPDLPAVRMNWSIYPSGDLFWPPERGARMEGRPFTPASNFIRIERQTLRRLPETGNIVFTIRIYSDPIGVLKALPGGSQTAKTLAARLEGLTPEQLAYKGMVSKKNALLAYLRANK